MKIIYNHAAETYLLDVERDASEIEIRIGDEHWTVNVLASELPRLTFSHEGKIQTARIVSDGKRRWVHWNGKTFVLERGADARARGTMHEREGTGSGIVTAPMPGQVRDVLVKVGDFVNEGQTLLLLEAMKMEIRVAATQTGCVAQLDARVGQSVEREQILARIEQAQAKNE